MKELRLDLVQAVIFQTDEVYNFIRRKYPSYNTSLELEEILEDKVIYEVATSNCYCCKGESEMIEFSFDEIEEILKNEEMVKNV